MVVSSTSKKKLELQLAKLKAPEWDSSSDEGEDDSVVDEKKANGDEKEEQKLISDVNDTKMKKNSTKKFVKRERDTKDKVSSVFYIGHLPKYFEEDEVMGFLKQFGHVVRLKVARSLNTGNCKGYAFVQMTTPKIANIVVDTLSGYMLFQKRLVCHMVPASQIHNGMFHSRTSKIVSKEQILDRKMKNKSHLFHGPKTISKMKHITLRLLAREKKKREAMKSLGINFEFPGYNASEQKMKDVDLKSISSVVDNSADDENISIKKTKNEHGKKRKTAIHEDGNSNEGKHPSGNDAEAELNEDATEKSTKSPKKKKKSKKRKESLTSLGSREEPTEDNNSKEKLRSSTPTKEEKSKNSAKQPEIISLNKKESTASKPEKEEKKEKNEGKKSSNPATTLSEKKKKKKTKKRRISAP